ncbi:beta-1,3-galactosyltransferase 1-like [Convolutriloba macropyga]|uniref:beta-1,3-galactosyltransferase 1-like n=1 Tax=Convolutriloba macropyga TaxID=536237 RepID=UPI003F51BD2E
MAFDFAVHECRNFDYFIKTDDDVYLNMDKVAYLFSTLKKAEKIMGGSSRHHVKPDRRKDSKFYLNEADYPEIFEPDFCVGAFYFMSLDVAEIIHKQFKKIRPIHLEDVFIGMCLNKTGIKPNVELAVENSSPKPPQHSFNQPHQYYAVHFGYAFFRLIPQFHQAIRTYGYQMESFKMTRNKEKTVSASEVIKSYITA